MHHIPLACKKLKNMPT